MRKKNKMRLGYYNKEILSFTTWWFTLLEWFFFLGALFLLAVKTQGNIYIMTLLFFSGGLFAININLRVLSLYEDYSKLIKSRILRGLIQISLNILLMYFIIFVFTDIIESIAMGSL